MSSLVIIRGVSLGFLSVLKPAFWVPIVLKSYLISLQGIKKIIEIQ
jgi:hypothetical protein